MLMFRAEFAPAYCEADASSHFDTLCSHRRCADTEHMHKQLVKQKEEHDLVVRDVDSPLAASCLSKSGRPESQCLGRNGRQRNPGR